MIRIIPVTDKDFARICHCCPEGKPATFKFEYGMIANCISVVAMCDNCVEDLQGEAEAVLDIIDDDIEEETVKYPPQVTIEHSKCEEFVPHEKEKSILIAVPAQKEVVCDA